MITPPGLLCWQLCMMTMLVALSQDTSSGDVKDKPPSPQLVGWALPQEYLSKEVHPWKAATARELQGKWNGLNWKVQQNPLQHPSPPYLDRK